MFLISQKVKANEQRPISHYSCLEKSDWSDEDVPREEIGQLWLTQNPCVTVIHFLKYSFFMLHFKSSQNYFAEIEQAAFAPGHMVNVTDLELGSQLTIIVYTFRLRASNHLKIPSFSPASSLIRVCVSSVLRDGKH
jgi:catalase